MREEQNIDELLNSFIDEELSARHRTEVQRLIAHDRQIARRLRQLQKCKLLLNNLPQAKAPDEMLANIKASLERRTLLGEPNEHFDRREGARHLLIRKVVAAAAMIGLLAVLSAVIYNIVSPEAIREKPVVSRDWQQLKPKVEAVGRQDRVFGSDIGGFSGTLELKTDNSKAVLAYISRAIEENGLSDCASLSKQADRNEYTLKCSRQAMNLLLSDLGSIWARLDSAKLFVQDSDIGKAVVVDSVTAEQVVEIASKDGFEECIRTAKDFAVLNRMSELLPARGLLAAISDNRLDSITIPKPVLTSKTDVIKGEVGKAEESEEVHLTIVVLAGQ